MPPRTRKTAAKKTTAKKAAPPPESDEDEAAAPAPLTRTHPLETKRLAPGERRYIAKSEQVGRRTLWGVYDRVNGSWPVRNPTLGEVKQDLDTEEEAQAEADRCEATRTGLTP